MLISAVHLSLSGSVVDGYGNFVIRLDPIFFHMVSDIQSKSTHSVAHEPKYLVVSILPHQAKVVAILPLVRYDWLKWSCDKYDTHKNIWVRI